MGQKMTRDEANAAVVKNGFDWYVVRYDDGGYDLLHRSNLSAILECGESMEDYGITAMQQCYNGENLGDLDF